MKKVLIHLLILVFILSSFYLTNKIIDDMLEKDSLMTKIKETLPKYEEAFVDAETTDNTIIPGLYGKTIDLSKTYYKMKKYGAYNEYLTVLKEIKPVISLSDYYDKYLISGNKSIYGISLIFIIKDNQDISKVLKILKEKNIVATFFIDGTFIEKNTKLIKTNREHEFELLSYKNSYNQAYFKTALSYLESLTLKKGKYCYTKDENNEILNLCKSLKLHTVIPTIHITNNSLYNIKKNIENAITISFEINPYIEKELPIVIDYIKNKGYTILLLEDLFKEDQKSYKTD